MEYGIFFFFFYLQYQYIAIYKMFSPVFTGNGLSESGLWCLITAPDKLYFIIHHLSQSHLLQGSAS